MQYELYKQITYNNDSIVLFIIENNNLQSIMTYIENFPLNDTENYLIIDNNSANPINYRQLGFSSPPTKREHYKTIYECKLAKEYYHQIKEDLCENCYIGYEFTRTLSNNILAMAELQTSLYFKKYNAKSKNKDSTN